MNATQVAVAHTPFEAEDLPIEHWVVQELTAADHANLALDQVVAGLEAMSGIPAEQWPGQFRAHLALAKSNLIAALEAATRSDSA